MSQYTNSQKLPLGFSALRHPNDFVLAGANNRNVIITYRFLAAPVRANRIPTAYLNRKYRPWYTRKLLGCLLGISPLGEIPAGAIILNSAHALLIINWFLVLFEFLIVVYLKGYSEENEVTMLFRFKKHNLLFSKHFFPQRSSDWENRGDYH